MANDALLLANLYAEILVSPDEVPLFSSYRDERIGA